MLALPACRRCMPRLRAPRCSWRPRGCDADRALLELWLDDAVA